MWIAGESRGSLTAKVEKVMARVSSLFLFSDFLSLFVSIFFYFFLTFFIIFIYFLFILASFLSLYFSTSISPYFISGLGIGSFAHRFFAHFAQIKWKTVSNLLRSLKTNERLWANRSGCSRQMSDCERIAQVAHKVLAKTSIILFFSMFYKGFFVKKRAICSFPHFW